MRNKAINGITKQDIINALNNLRQITFEVTDACNLRCKYCGYGDLYFGYDKREDKFLSFEKAKSLLDYLSDLWESNNAASLIPKTYVGFYGGEPLLNIKLIKEIVAYVENLNLKRNFVFTMTTNAVLLEKYMDFIAEKKFDMLISLDGNKDGQSYRIDHNGHNSFDRVYENIKILQQKYPEYFTGHVNFNAVLHNRNNVESAYNFIKDEFGKIPTISELNNSGIRQDRIEEFKRTYRNKEDSLYSSENYEKISDEMLVGTPRTERLLRFLHQYSGNTFRSYNDLFINTKLFSYRPTGTCNPFEKKLFLTANGKIIQCERIDHKFALGNVDDNNEVNLDIDYIVNRFNGYLGKLKKQCEKCYFNKSCAQCMYYIESVDDENPICHGFMGKEDFDKYKYSCLDHLREHPYLYKKLMTEVLVE